MSSGTIVRRKIVGGFGAMAVVLALTSVAYACTVFRGDMTFTKTGTPTSKTVTGMNVGMNWCGGTQNANFGATKGSPQSVSITSAVGTGCSTSQLSNGTYTVGLARGIMRQGGNPHINCHNTLLTSTLIGTYTVDNGAGGFSGGPQTYNYNANPSKGYDNICVYKTGGPDANSLNFRVV